MYHSTSFCLRCLRLGLFISVPGYLSASLLSVSDCPSLSVPEFLSLRVFVFSVTFCSSLSASDCLSLSNRLRLPVSISRLCMFLSISFSLTSPLSSLPLFLSSLHWQKKAAGLFYLNNLFFFLSSSNSPPPPHTHTHTLSVTHTRAHAREQLDLV